MALRSDGTGQLERVRRLFSWDLSAQQIKMFYEEII
jgi:hypothetical protein